VSQLLLYRFGADARYEGQLVGALERIQSRSRLDVLELLFVSRDAESAELHAISAAGRDFGSLVTALLDFRLDAGRRRRATERARRGAGGAAVADLGAGLEAGEAVAVVLVDQAAVAALEEAVAASGGTAMASSVVEATRLADVPLPL
jgi:hypothetical protein